MKIICIADTHNKHNDINIPPGDVIVHAGDFTEAGTRSETINFLTWFSALPHSHKIIVPGNHDFYLQKNLENLNEIIPHNIHCLIDSGVEIENLKFWGSPFTPGNGRWAFNKARGKEIRKTWDLVPVGTDFLITHTPAYGVLDELDNKQHIGCEELWKRVKEVKIPYHIFGHIHNDYGIVRTRNTTYINASILDNRYRVINSPIIFNYISS
ncbi:metallophosphatase domain-containing protein [Antarcticibacterium sp. 1MA-6-2]|uniref:metallophosphatase domain-containing protein n=1 Tax=Antarcticibacterium sp. 1MA-6-2 TaxID=2908210 RepID=UPI001F33B508|nr:metallophosphatase domain-containing protein [Antarcticibacterium sp. 1MA-6-2]UJH90854.1 metallophosphatase domain-containing protein [Antarcticibacterium sp. 1MA-6-2]